MERKVVKSASKLVFTSERATSLYRELYPEEDPGKFITIENGYYLNEPLRAEQKIDKKKFQLLYSGALYTNGRDPKPLFYALAELKSQKIINKANFILTFRAGKIGAYYSLFEQLNISDLIEFLPPVSFKSAVAEMQQASATVLIQDEIFHRQIPGKIYDYISVKRPILAITPKNSATADLMSELSFGVCAWGVSEIANSIKTMLNEEIDCDVPVEHYSRKVKNTRASYSLKCTANPVFRIKS